MTDVLTVVGLIASIASLVLAIVAIWLSVVFYRLSNKQAESSSKNAQEITTGISRLEKVFDGLYSDTFSMMKDTVTDMRKHIWHRDDLAPKPALSAESSEQADSDLTKEAISEFEAKLGEFSAQLGIADDKIETLRHRLAPVVRESAEKALTPAARVRAAVVEVLARRSGAATTISVLTRWVRRIVERQGIMDVASLVIDAVFDLRHDGRVTWDGPEDTLDSTSEISLVHQRPVAS